MRHILSPHAENYKPHVERLICSNPYMDNKSKDILAANIERLKGDKTYAEFPARVGQGSIKRVLDGQNVRLSTLDALAKGFKLKAWELLTPDLDPADPPSRRLDELEGLRQWRDDVMERAARTKHGTMVDARRLVGNVGSGKGKGKQQEGNEENSGGGK